MARAQEAKYSTTRRLRKVVNQSNRHSLPKSSSNGIPRKKQIMARRIRAIALCAFSLVLLATVAAHRQRRSLPNLRDLRRFTSINSFKNMTIYRNSRSIGDSLSDLHQRFNNQSARDVPGGLNQTEDRGSESSETLSENNEVHSETEPNGDTLSKFNDMSQSAANQVETRKGIEMYTRSDVLDGTRSLCRISDACLLGNGIISVPLWMMKEERTLKRCGLGTRLYHDANGPKQAQEVQRINGDLIHHYRLPKLKEPSALMTEFFTETVLHSAFLLETFWSSPAAPQGVSYSHCTVTESGDSCDQGVQLGPPRAVSPLVVVPEKHLAPDGSWENGAFTLLENAYGHESLKRVAIQDVVNEEDKSKSSNVSARCYNSMFTTEARFKDIPDNFFADSSMRLFARSQISKTSSRDKPTSANITCGISIAILRRSGSRTIQSVDTLKEKIELIAKTALPQESVEVKVLELSKDVSFQDQVERFRNVDILIGPTSHSLSHVAFLPIGASVFEIFPFGWQPSTFEDLARISGVVHHAVLAVPQTADFKACIEHELFQLRKQDRLQGDENPPWAQQMERRWDEAASEFALSGKSTLSLSSDSSGISNFHTRACARRQHLDFNPDELAKTVLLDAREMCSKQTAAVP